MISRSRFFRASLWAALGPVVILVAGIIFLMLFPKLYRLGDNYFMSSGLALLAVPFAYTVVVVATYGIGRALYALGVLNRVTLFVVYAVLAAVLAWSITWLMAESGITDVMRWFVILFVAGLLAAISSVVVWWRVVTRVDPGALQDEDIRPRMRRRQRRGFFRRLASKW